MVETIKRASLAGETWRAVKSSLPAFMPLILVYGVVFFGSFYFLIQHAFSSDLTKQLHDNPQLFKQHPELSAQYIHEVIGKLGWVLLLLPIAATAYYTFTVKYLRLAMKKNQPEYGVGNFFHWFSKVAWKYIRPILWHLIPIIGMFFYWRSIIRYILVSPLAALGREPELKTSWEMTEGNWWRIFGNYFLLIFLISIGIFFVALILGFLLAFLTHVNPAMSAYLTYIAYLLQGLSGGFMVMVSCIYSCTAYRVLLQERRQASLANN